MSNSPEYAPAPAATSRTRRILLALWAALTVLTVAFVFSLGSNCPNADEWEFVPALLNREPLGPWLWAQHNEHRLPLPRFLYWFLFQFTHDFRAGSLLQIAILSATSLAMMSLAARLRGAPHWADAFFPVSLLHVGHWENLLIGYNICFAFILALEAAIGAIAICTTRENAFRSGCLAGVLLCLLCLCGGGGVVTAIPVAAWLAYLAIGFTKSNPARTAILLAFAAFPAFYLALYLHGYHKPGHHPDVGEGGTDVLRVAAQVLSIGFGSGTFRWWLPISTGLLVLGAATFRLVLRSMNRPAMLGTFSIFAGIIGVALVIGMGRAGIDPRYGVASRYSYLTWPLLALVYMLWAREHSRAGKWIPVAMCLAASLFFIPNMATGMKRGWEVKQGLLRIESESLAGSPPEVIVRLFSEKPCLFQLGQEQRAVRAMPMLREAGIGAFAEARP
ncbi:MAG: hypothetical protein U0791_22015 [Gemmataceae bacterium]